MEKLTNVKEKLKGLNYKVYSLHMIEPKFEDLTEGSLVCKEHTAEFIYLDENKMVTVLKLNYDDIANVHIDNILVNIKMKNGEVYHLHQLRQNLDEILKDFKGQYLSIEDERIIHILQNYKIKQNGCVLNITGVEIDEYNVSKPFKDTIDLNSIYNIHEDYWGSADGFREVFINLKNGEELAIWIE